MPELVCRLSWRKGLPLGICVSPRRGFLDLPRELRDKIYHYSLFFPEPINVWSGLHLDYNDTIESPGKVTRTSTKAVRTFPSILGLLGINLLECNHQVSCEAAPVLYARNTFRITGQNNWNPLYAFLQMIGDENRNHLRRVELSVSQPRHVCQYPDGTRMTMGDWRLREVIPRGPIAQCLSPTFLDRASDRVEHLDPAIEACFRILGHRRLPLTLTLTLNRHYLPGVQMMYDEQHEYTYCFTMDVPILIEMCRKAFTEGDDMTSLVEVLWKGECTRHDFAEQKTLIQDNGWVIVEAKDGYTPHDNFPLSTTLFILRVKETIGKSQRPARDHDDKHPHDISKSSKA